jgi:hypothetical protein
MVGTVAEVTGEKLLATKAAIQAEIASITNTNDPAEFVAQADALLASYDAGTMARDAQVSALRARRDEVADTYRVREREREAAAISRREAERQVLCDLIVEKEASKLARWERAEAHFTAYLAEYHGIMADLADQREASKKLARGGKIPRQFDHMENSNRFSARTAALAVKLLCGMLRLGWITWTGGGIHANRETGWRDQEAKISAPAVDEIVHLGGRQ